MLDQALYIILISRWERSCQL